MAVATIDSFKMNQKLHGASAVIGFVGFFITMIMMTYMYTLAKKINPLIISDYSLKIKTTITVTMGAIALYIVQHPFMILNDSYEWSDEQTSVIEWSIFFSICLFVFTFYWDYKGYYYFWSLETLLLNDVENSLIVNEVL